MSNKKSVFNDNWPLDADYHWAQRVSGDPRSCHCTLCNKTFSLSNMGIGALMSHKLGAKHKAALNSKSASYTIKDFFEKPGSGSCYIH